MNTPEDFPAPPNQYGNAGKSAEWAIANYQFQIALELRGIRDAFTDGSDATETDATPEEAPVQTDGSAPEERDTVAAQVADKLTAAGFSTNGLNITHVPNEDRVTIAREDGHELTDEFAEWTRERFGKGNPGDVVWGEYEKEDGETGYYPKAYQVPSHALPEVFE